MKGKPGKNPAFQMYPSDWLNDIELQSASFETIGIWANCLMLMWVAKNRGELSGTEQQLCKLIRCSKDEFERFLDEAQTLLFCYVSRSNNNDITLRNRRMFREAEYREKAKENNRLRQQRFREKNACNGDVTPRHNDTSTSTSISTSISTSKSKKKNKQKKKVQVEIPDWLDKVVWKNYQDHRKEIKAPMTSRAEELAIKKLENFKEMGFNPVDIINQSIEMGWKGLFEINNKARQVNEPGVSRTQAFNRQSMQRAMEIIGDDE
jgi:uncharacterized protein YdaU (DUF1376 family)